MKILVLDIDNTIIIHNNIENDFYNKKNHSKLNDLISSIGFNKVYIYTNGTYGHGEGIVNNLQLRPIVNKIYARDTLPSMKPSYQSFDFVDNEINKNNPQSSTNEIIFFDDMIENLVTASRMGWKTVWISPNFLNKEKFIDYAFPNIYEGMIYFKLKK
tara:strand:- start:458 stop:931 length:474 start_codon:yes stop_codon:yes gene_type:complete